VFAVDTSGSVRPERFPDEKRFIKSVIDNLEVGMDKTRIGVVTWSDSAKVAFHLNQYNQKQDIKQAVEYLAFTGGRTHTSSALKMARDRMFQTSNGDRDNVPNYLFILTDGNSNVNPLDTVPEAIATRLNGVHIITVSIGQQLGKYELSAMASQTPKDNMYSVDSFDNLPQLMPQMPMAICDDENECESNPCQSGGSCVDDIKRYYCICPAGRTGKECQFSCTSLLDVVFVLDMSGSVQEKFDMAVAFMISVVQKLDMTFGRVRVGAITYGDTATLHFDLNTYRNKQEVLNAAVFIPNRGKTNTQSALSMARAEVFTAAKGDRAGVKNVLIAVTDGHSNVQAQNTIPEAEAARREGAAVYVVALGDEVNMREVTSMAGSGNEPVGNFVFRVANMTEIEEVATELTIDHLCA